MREYSWGSGKGRMVKEPEEASGGWDNWGGDVESGGDVDVDMVVEGGVSLGGTREATCGSSGANTFLNDVNGGGTRDLEVGGPDTAAVGGPSLEDNEATTSKGGTAGGRRTLGGPAVKLYEPDSEVGGGPIVGETSQGGEPEWGDASPPKHT